MRERAATTGGEDGAFCRVSRCPFVTGVDERAYVYLPGHYLGDGMLSLVREAFFKLRLRMCDAHPGIMAECLEAIRAVMPANAVSAIQRRGLVCTEVISHSKHWICLFPQHGAGRKHLRPIVLQPWQERIALNCHPRQLLRGLIHSDGRRSMNWVTGRAKEGSKQYPYPRYLFSNESDAILGMFVEACHRVGIECRANRRTASRSLVERASFDLIRLSDRSRSARGGSRTRTPFRTMGLESIVYANSTTRALQHDSTNWPGSGLL